MVKELMTAFLDATERVRREEAWGGFFAEHADEDDEGFSEASVLEAGSRWQQGDWSPLRNAERFTKHRS